MTLKQEILKYRIPIVCLVFVLFIWPSPLLFTNHVEHSFEAKCAREWNSNIRNLKEALSSTSSSKYISYSKSFSRDWLNSDLLKGTDLGCFGNLDYQDKSEITNFNAKIDEYQRQLNLGNMVTNPLPDDSLRYISKVNYSCDAPNLLAFKFRVSCLLFLT